MLVVAAIGLHDEQLIGRLRELKLRVSTLEFETLSQTLPAGVKGPDAFVVDIRSYRGLPPQLAQLRRQFPLSGLVIIAKALEPTLMLEAMRMGANEWVVEPLLVEELLAAIQRVARPAAKPQIGRIFAVIGSKGGIGTTTVAVNLATSLRTVSNEPTLLIDLHLSHGDAAVFLGVEPRFSVVDALENVHRLDDAYFKGLVTHTKAEVDLLASSNHLLTHAFDSSRIKSLLDFATTNYRYVVLDCPRNDATMLEAIDAASQIIVLANQELTTLRTASRIVNNLRQRCGSERIKLAISRLDPQAEIGQPDVERVLGGPVKYVFPNDYRTSLNAITRGEPLVLQNHSKLAGSLDSLAHELSGIEKRKPSESKGGGLFGIFGGR